MTRAQRRWHARLWLAMGPMMVAAVVLALRARAPIQIQSNVELQTDDSNHGAVGHGAAIQRYSGGRP